MWQQKETAFQLDALRLNDEGAAAIRENAAAIREKNVSAWLAVLFWFVSEQRNSLFLVCVMMCNSLPTCAPVSDD